MCYMYGVCYIFMVVFIFLMNLVFLTLIEGIFWIIEWDVLSLEFLFDVKLYFYFDYISNLFMIVISLIAFSAFYFSEVYMENDKNKSKFKILTLMFVVMMYLMVISLNSFFILLGWDGLGLVSYLLVIHYYSEYSNYSGIVTIMTNRLGDLGLIFSVFLILSGYSMDIILINSMESLNIFFLILVVLGASTKSAQFPFSAWLPLAMAAPTPISALVHSSTLVTAGVYLYIRYYFLFKNNFLLIKSVVVLSSITLFLAGVMAMSEMDIKKVIAYSTMSQLGLMVMIVLIGNEVLSFFHIVTHALFKALLFFCSGVLIHEFLDNQDVRNFSMNFKSNPLVILIFMVSSLSLMGVPFLSGFYSKDLMLELVYTLNYNFYIFMMLLISTMFTSLYSLRLLELSSSMGMKGFKYIYMSEWSKINNSLFVCFFGVLISGAVMNWLILEKLEFFYFKFSVKVLTLILVVLGMYVYYLLNYYNMISKFQSAGYSLLYLLSFQGMFSNFMMLKMNYFYYHVEMMIENLLLKNNVKTVGSFSELMVNFKFLNFYLIFLFVVVLLILF